MPKSSINSNSMVSTHSRLKAAGHSDRRYKLGRKVSTHSRLKAAGGGFGFGDTAAGRFNTQPPKGGWASSALISAFAKLFQHTAA